jgi:hypothetical protein
MFSEIADSDEHYDGFLVWYAGDLPQSRVFFGIDHPVKTTCAQSK